MYKYLNTDLNRELSKLLDEIWKPVIGYEGLYEVSNLGRVKSVKRQGNNIERIIKTWSGKYLTVVLSKNGKSKTHKLHRLIAIAFIPNSNGYKIVNHKNANKHDNRVDNLEWCNYSMNNKHAYMMGLIDQSGENNGNSKITAREAKFIRYIKAICPEISNGDISRFYGISRSEVGNVVNNLNWK